MPDRAGRTTTSELELRPGSVTVLAYTHDSAVSVPLAIASLAAELGLVLGQPPQPVAQTPAGWQWVIGQGRPVTLRMLPLVAGGQTERWYRSVDPTPAPSARVASIHIDWRGAPETVSWPSGDWVIPRPKHAVYGRPNWPDGDWTAQVARVALEEQDAELSRLAGLVRDTGTVIARELRSSGLVLAGLTVSGIIGYLLARR